MRIQPEVRAVPSSWRRLPARLGALPEALWLLGGTVVLTLVTWQQPSLLAQAGLDQSWNAALHLAAHERLRFGHDVLFTYGPLGFLSIPVLYFASTATLAFAFVAATHVGLMASLLKGARRSFSWVLALGLVYVVASLPILHSDVLALILFLWSVPALERPGGWEARWLVALGGALSAVAVLVKFNVGLLSIGIVVVAVCSLPGFGWRRPAWLATSFLVTLLALWVAAGGAVTDISSWLRGSVQITRGYSEALALEVPGLEWQYFVAGTMLTVLAFLVWTQAAAYPIRRRVGLLLLVAGYSLFFFKEGFVRHDTHAALFFPAVAVAVVPFAWPGRRRWLSAAIVLLAAVTTLETFNLGPNAYFNPIGSAREFVNQSRTLAEADRRSDTISEGRETVRNQTGIDADTLAELAGRTVHVDPYETSIVWAHELVWRPLPVFQAYSAYTAALDGKNASLLASDRAPERILRQYIPIRVDGKSPEFESPATFLAMLCGYEQTRATSHWQVLARTDGRCGAPRLIRSVRAYAGESVEVPKAAPSEIVFARIRIETTFRDRVRELFYKPLRFPNIILDGVTTYRLTSRTASNPHVLHVPASSGFSRDFSGELDTKQLQMTNVPSPVRVEFFAARLDNSSG